VKPPKAHKRSHSKAAIAERFAAEFGRERTTDPLALIHKHELAALLSVNPWTLDNWRKSGRMPPPIALSPQIVAWRRSDIDAWLRERQAAAAQHRPPNPRLQAE
jgi:predicted DNA-binding transcriptional regulator AlpA